ncbi:MAG TPA: hypothetical protein VMU94_19075 [Streptosporangiaceae bacterium]|nr:hypothetical protein [Streptosporangiaceae bacterium]
MKPIDLEALGLTEREIDHQVVAHSESFGRLIRQDPAQQLGVPTQYLAMLAVARDDWASAETLARYMQQEADHIFDSMMTLWLSELLDYAGETLGLKQFATLMRVPRLHVWASLQRLGNDFIAEAISSLRGADAGAFDIGLSHARRVYKTMGDETVKFIQDILTQVAEAEGDDGPAAAMREPYEHIWRRRYATWESLTGEERLQLSCEGMRAHYGGPTRQGEFRVIDEGSRYRMTFAGCGTGGVLRRGDPETGEGPYQTEGIVRVPKPYSWGQTGMPWYCVHCSLYLEHWPAAEEGVNRRPVIFVDADGSPVTTEWLVYKNLADTEAEDYLRIWASPPASSAAGSSAGPGASHPASPPSRIGKP